MAGRFDGRIALVTGGAGGIGLAVARDLALEGARVHVLDLKCPPDALVDLPGVTVYACDLRDGDRVRAVTDAIADADGHIDHVVNAAGLCLFERDGPLETSDEEVFTATMDVNLGAAMRVVRATLPLMRRAGGGSFVHVASVVGLRVMENITEGGPADAYQLSKAAVVSLSRSLALQHAGENIRSNTVCPGSILTPMTAGIYEDPARVAAMERRTPLRRLGQPADVSAATLFLLSDAASFITGIDLVVDGGLMAKL